MEDDEEEEAATRATSAAVTEEETQKAAILIMFITIGIFFLVADCGESGLGCPRREKFFPGCAL